jgi:hypothetical protein
LDSEEITPGSAVAESGRWQFVQVRSGFSRLIIAEQWEQQLARRKTRIAQIALRLDRVGRLKRPLASMPRRKSKNWPSCQSVYQAIERFSNSAQSLAILSVVDQQMCLGDFI